VPSTRSLSAKPRMAIAVNSVPLPETIIPRRPRASQARGRPSGPTATYRRRAVRHPRGYSRRPPEVPGRQRGDELIQRMEVSSFPQEGSRREPRRHRAWSPARTSLTRASASLRPSLCSAGRHLPQLNHLPQQMKTASAHCVRSCAGIARVLQYLGTLSAGDSKTGSGGEGGIPPPHGKKPGLPGFFTPRSKVHCTNSLDHDPATISSPVGETLSDGGAWAPHDLSQLREHPSSLQGEGKSECVTAHKG